MVGKTSQATRLVDLARAAELFHSSHGEAYAAIEVNSHREIWRLQDREFKRWLAQEYYKESGKAPSSQAMADALGVLAGQALYGSPEYDVFTRLAKLGDALYLDLGNKFWEAVKITASEWRVVSRPPARFRRTRGMRPLPNPRAGGCIDELRRFVNVGSQDDWVVLVAWLVGTFHFGGPFPVLVLQGEQGSAKSTTARLLRSLIDPNTCPLRAQPHEQRDLMIAAQNSWIAGFDNVSYLPGWLSDALCSLATGGGFSTRQLHTDDQEILFNATRPILLNGIDGVVVRGDLLDRSLVLQLPAISPGQRRSEQELWTKFHLAQPQILGALLDAVVGALRDYETTNLRDLPRMADFARWATAAESALGWRTGTVVAACRKNQAEASASPLDASPIVPALRSLLRSGSFKGTASDLLRQLEAQNGQPAKRPHGWPRSPHDLSRALHRLAPNLRSAGVRLTFRRSAGGGSRRIIELADEGLGFSDPHQQ